jgi:ABC-2 type transport system permease protein
VLNIFLVLANVTGEKKDKVRLFVLSLPISTAQYTVAKMVANLIAFFVPWLVLTAGSLIVIAFTTIPDGLMPITLAVCTYLLAYFCVLLGAAIVSESQFGPGAVILAGNVSLNFVIAGLFRMRSIGAHASGNTAVWGSEVFAILAIELVVGALALVLAFAHQSRRKDFV